MSRKQLNVALLIAAAMVLVAGIFAVSVSGGSSKAAKVTAIPSPSLWDTLSAGATSASPTAASTVTPSTTVQPTHFPVATRTPSSLFPTSHESKSPGAGVAPTSTTCHVTSGSQLVANRQIIVDLPQHFPAPVIFDYHGGNQSATQEHGYTGLGAAGAKAGFIVVTPNGTGGRWNFPTTEDLPNDVVFTQGVASMLVFAGCSNGKLYAAGISDGADMAVTAGCRIREVRGVFAVAPSITPRSPCTRKPFFEVHGTSDPVVPYSGSAAGSFADTPSEPVSARFPYWTSGCLGPGRRPSPATGTSVQVWTCGPERTVQLDSVSGGGHTWPGAVGSEPVGGLGARASWSATAAAIAFFQAH